MITYLPHYPEINFGEWHMPVNKDLHFASSPPANGTSVKMFFMAGSESARLTKRLRYWNVVRRREKIVVCSGTLEVRDGLLSQKY